MVQHLCKEACYVGTPTKTEEEDVVIFIALSVAANSALPVRIGNPIVEQSCQTMDSQDGFQGPFFGPNLSQRTLDTRTCIKNL